MRRFGVWCDRAGIARATGTHCLRHSFATRLYRRTRDLLLVRTALHHRSITSTMVYAVADRDEVRRVVSA
jgi:site-specific recombinase XerD